jgi:Ca2+-binding EF-hand superfamily protein
MRVETSFQPGSGIRYLLEATENQLVAVDTNKTLKFYEFIDKALKEEREKVAAEEELLINGLKELFDKYDADQNGMLEFEEFCIMAQDFFSAFGVDQQIVKGKWSAEQEQKLRAIFQVWDEDNSNFLTKAEMRPIVKKMMQQGFKFKNITSTK